MNKCLSQVSFKHDVPFFNFRIERKTLMKSLKSIFFKIFSIITLSDFKATLMKAFYNLKWYVFLVSIFLKI